MMLRNHDCFFELAVCKFERALRARSNIKEGRRINVNKKRHVRTEKIMESREPNKKRLRRISNQLDEMVRVDIVKELGDRGLEGAVYGILRHLILAEIWEVISHSSALRQWMHRRNIWKKLAEDRIPGDLLQGVIKELSWRIRNRGGINYMWIILAIDSQIFDTENGTIMRKWKNEYGEPSVQITQILHDEGVVDTFERAFPNGHKIYAEVLEKTDINGKRVVVAVLELLPEHYDEKNDEYFEHNDPVDFAVFWYLILAGGGTAMVQTFKGGVFGLSQETVLDTFFFEQAYQQLTAGSFEPAVMLPTGDEPYKMIRSEVFY
jgi:hypothetical protein